MALYQTLYFMSLIGAIAGLFSWACLAVFSAAVPTFPQPDLIAATILGGFIGGLTVGFSDRWSGNPVSAQWIFSGALIGIVAGAAAGLLQIPITNNIAPQAPMVARLITWILCGSFIGLGLGLRWFNVNRLRVLHAMTGGFLGGAIGGAIFAGLGSRVPDLSHALGFVAVGVGICFGVTLAPILLRDGVLEFVSSGDARAQYKFGRSHKQWEVQQGDSYVIGSQSQDMSKTAYRPAVQVFIPDAGIAPRHAVLFGREGRFFVSRHPDISDPAGFARFVVRVRGRSISGSQEIRHEDDLLLGRTALKFMTRKREQ